MNKGDVVKIVNSHQSIGGRFCLRHGLTGIVEGHENGHFIIDFNIGYPIYATPDNLEVVARKESIPSLTSVVFDD